MEITLKEYENELNVLKENKQVCSENSEILEFEMMFVDSLIKENKGNEELLRLKTNVNDRYYLNDEMISFLNFAIEHLKTTKEIDEVYTSYLDKINGLTRHIVKISLDKDFVDLRNKYLPNVAENIKSL